MFTGLIQKVGEVVSLSPIGGGARLRLRTSAWDAPLALGESISVQGVCLTLVDQDGDELSFDLLKETLERSSLGHTKPGALVNVERALRFGDALGGHLVNGHVDGVGNVLELGHVGQDHVLTIECDKALSDGMVYKGSIACDGISLTIARCDTQSFDVHIIPHTWKVTSLSSIKVGDVVNLELDIVGKFVKKYASQGVRIPVLSWEELQSPQDAAEAD